jgi:type IX secretion system PorP/SprF family membrane protein
MSGMYFMYNPAYAGAAGIPSMRISSYSFLPGNGFGIRSFYGSYDSYSQALHGGAGIWLSDDMLGEVMNDFRAGASYAYHLQAGKNLYLNAGLTASLVHRGIKTGSVILPGDIDPFNGFTGISSEVLSSGNISQFDLGTGISIAGDTWYGGFSVMHLTQPWLSERHQSYNRLHRLYTVNGGLSFTPGKTGLTLNPSASLLIQEADFIAYLGTEALFREIMCGLAVWHAGNGFTAAEPSLGWDTGSVKLILSYSYTLSGGDYIIKGSAVVKAGFSICFNNVEKRKAIHVIKLPEL